MDGGLALNYTRVTHLLTTQAGRVCGVGLQDLSPAGSGRRMEIESAIVVNATGAWADELRQQANGKEQLRKLRGSHLVFPGHRLPLTRSVSFLHPQDGRPVFALPWENVTIFGTTDVDHNIPLSEHVCISQQETEYLLNAVQFAFRNQELGAEDIQSAYAGVRPVVNTGKANPSKESREHLIWYENGLLTVAGGKLTTFRLMARDALNKIHSLLPGCPRFNRHMRVLSAPAPDVELPGNLSPLQRLRLIGRYGLNLPGYCASILPGELEPIADTNISWAELRWAARAEAVLHLDDLLLRRARLGLLLPKGGLDYLDGIRSIVQSELTWDASRWDLEIDNYIKLWQKCYHPGCLTFEA
jgi:glycerol-3-phosphate dehydrogenase